MGRPPQNVELDPEGPLWSVSDQRRLPLGDGSGRRRLHRNFTASNNEAPESGCPARAASPGGARRAVRARAGAGGLGGGRAGDRRVRRDRGARPTCLGERSPRHNVERRARPAQRGERGQPRRAGRVSEGAGRGSPTSCTCPPRWASRGDCPRMSFVSARLRGQLGISRIHPSAVSAPPAILLRGWGRQCPAAPGGLARAPRRLRWRPHRGWLTTGSAT